jgi:arsenite-transporting ATPase
MASRIILYTGKGGVGKTTVAAATALRAAELGYSTIVLSTDAAHSLGDSLDKELGPEPVKVAKNLWAQEIDVYYSIEKHWQTLQRYLSAVLRWQGAEGLLAEEMSVIPGMEEGASLLWVNQHHAEGKYEVIIVDCAPTAETLRLLSLPDVGRWWFDHLFPIGKRATLLLGPVARPFLDNMPLPDREIFDAVEQLFDKLGEIHGLLSDPSVSTVRLVMNPEKMVIKETQRTYTYLNLYGYVTDLVAINRLIPENAGEFMAGWREAQQRYVQMVEEIFSPLPIIRIPLLEQEVVGLKMLRRLADVAFGQDDPTRVYYSVRAQEYARLNSHYELRLKLPFARKEDLSLLLRGEEITLQVGHYRRNIILPRTLVGMEVEGATFEGDTLVITFLSPEASNRKGNTTWQ